MSPFSLQIEQQAAQVNRDAWKRLMEGVQINVQGFGSIPYTPQPKVPTMFMRSQTDVKNRERINTLDPKVRLKAMAHLKACDLNNIWLRITHGERTFAAQDLLYAQGRTMPGKIVTNAKGGQSWHNFCFAYDVVPLDANGKAIWDTNNPIWQTVIDLGKESGMEHGIKVGKWIDMPHFQYTFNKKLTLATARELYAAGILHSWKGII